MNDTSSVPPSWPGTGLAPSALCAQLRSIARIAHVAEEARQWTVDAAYETPLSKVRAKVPTDLAIKWIESCQDVYASSHQWGPACVLEKTGEMAHIYAVHAMLQAINETIIAAASYLSMSEPDRFVHGARACQMAARAVTHARSLIAAV